ncbi:MAG: fumarylacetoacetate hydrolase family protein [Novosphingobium sp.]|nr:fumarylacetoacetate hydrolase family protein [Novosphingobium sp.]
MKLARIGQPGQERPAILDSEGRLRDLSAHVSDIGPATLSDGEIERMKALDIDDLPLVEAPVRYGPPVAQTGKIICIGLNYTDHAAEVGLPVPTEPTVFIKACRTSGPSDPIRLPKGAEKGDWEVELAIVIGKGGLYIEEDDALDHVAGYALFHDVSERSYQMERGGQWTKGKSFPGFAPLGPWLVTTDELGDAGDLGIWLEVNGVRHQDGTTRNLVFGVRQVVSYLSRFFELEPGDVIATGTPAGVGLGLRPPQFLKAGDVVKLGIDGLGVQEQRIVGWETPVSGGEQ